MFKTWVNIDCCITDLFCGESRYMTLKRRTAHDLSQLYPCIELCNQLSPNFFVYEKLMPRLALKALNMRHESMRQNSAEKRKSCSVFAEDCCRHYYRRNDQTHWSRLFICSAVQMREKNKHGEVWNVLSREEECFYLDIRQVLAQHSSHLFRGIKTA